jgi:hypothetical protein
MASMDGPVQALRSIVVESHLHRKDDGKESHQFHERYGRGRRYGSRHVGEDVCW